MNVEQVVRSKEDAIRFQTFESAFAWDAQGNEILAKDGQQYEVTFTPPELAALKDATMTHNHPNGSSLPDSDPQSAGNSFSPEDIAFAMACDLAEIRVVTPKLRFSMKRPASSWNHLSWIFTAQPLLQRIENVVALELTRSVRRGTLTQEQADARYWHEIWFRASRRFGLDYTREES